MSFILIITIIQLGIGILMTRVYVG